MAEVQAITPAEAAAGIAGKWPSNPYVEYVLNVPPYTRYQSDGTKLFSGTLLTTAQAAAVAAQTTLEYHPTALFPALSVAAAIVATAVSLNVLGGGIVRLPPGTITLTQSLPLYNGVKYRGSGANWKFQNSTFGAGNSTTLLQGDGTFPCFLFNGTDSEGGAPSNFNTFTSGMLLNAEVSGLGINNFSFGIKVGALYQVGACWSQFKDLHITNCTNWGVWLENCIQCQPTNLNCLLNVEGGIAFVNSGGSALNSGNMATSQLFVQGAALGGTSRGVIFWARGAGGSLNQMTGINIQTNTGSAAAVTQLATMAGASTSVGVTDGTKFRKYMPVEFSATANGFFQGQIYFVASVSGNTLTISDAKGGTAITAAGSTPVNIITKGFEGIEVFATDTAVLQPMSFYGIDIEGWATAAVSITQLTSGAANINMQCNLVPAGQSGSCTHTFVVRNVGSGQIISAGSGGGLATRDFDTNSSALLVAGFFGSWGNAGNNPSNGLGAVAYSGAQTQGWANNTLMVFLRGTYGPQIGLGSGLGDVRIEGSLMAGQKTISNGGFLLQSGGNGMLWVANITANGSCSFPVVSASGASMNIGTLCCVSNPTAFTLTCNTQSAQNIKGLGASGTSVVIAANSSAIFQLAADGSGTPFVARLA